MTDLEKVLADSNRSLTLENQNLKLVITRLLAEKGMSTQFISGVFADCRRAAMNKVFKEEK